MLWELLAIGITALILSARLLSLFGRSPRQHIPK
jgi:hypothetical protein